MTSSEPKWKNLSFRDADDIPATPEARAAHIRERAMEKLGLHESEINPAAAPAYPGTMPLRNIATGGIEILNVFEVQISEAAAQRLSRQYDPDLPLISDIVIRQQPAMGANNPRKLPKGPKIKY
mgnify:CR=1 FL=1